MKEKIIQAIEAKEQALLQVMKANTPFELNAAHRSRDSERAKVMGLLDAMQSRLEELNKKVEELEKDAARYRWLREEKTDSRYYPLSGRIVTVIEFETESSDISEAIDTAMQANKGK